MKRDAVEDSELHLDVAGFNALLEELFQRGSVLLEVGIRDAVVDLIGKAVSGHKVVRHERDAHLQRGEERFAQSIVEEAIVLVKLGPLNVDERLVVRLVVKNAIPIFIWQTHGVELDFLWSAILTRLVWLSKVVAARHARDIDTGVIWIIIHPIVDRRPRQMERFSLGSTSRIIVHLVLILSA